MMHFHLILCEMCRAGLGVSIDSNRSPNVCRADLMCIKDTPPRGLAHAEKG